MALSETDELLRGNLERRIAELEADLEKMRQQAERGDALDVLMRATKSNQRGHHFTALLGETVHAEGPWVHSRINKIADKSDPSKLERDFLTLAHSYQCLAAWVAIAFSCASGGRHAGGK